MKLVSAYKYIIILFLLSGGNIVQAQQIWTLKECIDTAHVRNKNLQISRNQIAIGEQKEKESKANLIPKITANTDYKYFSSLPYQLMPMSTFNPEAPEGQFKEAQFGVPHNINANLQLSMSLYNPQVYGAIRTTKTASELAELQYQKNGEQIYFEISTLYYNAQILRHQEAFMDSNLINSNKLLRNMQLLKEQLLVTGTEVSKVKLQTEQLNTQKENINSKYTQVLNALKFAMGISMDRPIEIETDIHFQTSIAYTVVPTLDLRINITQNKLLTDELSTLNKSRYLPILNLFASYGTTGFGYDKNPNDFLRFYPISFAGIQLSYPLFNGTVTRRKINQKQLEISNNDLQQQLIYAKSEMEIENANRQITVAQQTVRNTENQIVLAKKIYEQTILQQKQSTASLTDVLLADNALREAQQNSLSAIVYYLKADLELKKLTGNFSTIKTSTK